MSTSKNYIQGGYITEEDVEEFECCLNEIPFWVTEDLYYNVEANNCAKLFKMFEQLEYYPFDLRVNEEVFYETGTIYITFKVSGIDDIQTLKSNVLKIEN